MLLPFSIIALIFGDLNHQLSAEQLSSGLLGMFYADGRLACFVQYVFFTTQKMDTKYLQVSVTFISKKNSIFYFLVKDLIKGKGSGIIYGYGIE